MTMNLEELITLRKREQEEEQRRHLLAMAAQVEAGLGPRVMEAIATTSGEGPAPWETSHATALLRFRHRGGEFHLTVTSLLGVNRVEVELRHVDGRFASLAKKASPGDIGEDWFLNALDTLATQISDRLANPRNFV